VKQWCTITPNIIKALVVLLLQSVCRGFRDGNDSGESKTWMREDTESFGISFCRGR